MLRRLFLLSCILVSGCDQSFDQLFDWLSGQDTQRVVIKETPFVLDRTGLMLSSEKPLRVVGESSSVCLVLKQGVPLLSQPEMDRRFRSVTKDAKFTGWLETTNGERFSINSVGQAWALHGPVTGKGEMSACLSCRCGPTPSVGSQIAKIHVAASKTLKALGVYWESTSAFDDADSS